MVDSSSSAGSSSTSPSGFNPTPALPKMSTTEAAAAWMASPLEEAATGGDTLVVLLSDVGGPRRGVLGALEGKARGPTMLKLGVVAVAAFGSGFWSSDSRRLRLKTKPPAAEWDILALEQLLAKRPPPPPRRVPPLVPLVSFG